MQINIENFAKICRTCCSQESLVPISTSKLQDDVSVAEVLSDFIPVSDLDNEQLPSQICSLCIHNLTKYYIFKKTCIKNECFLKSCLEKYIAETKAFIKLDEYNTSDHDNDIHDDLPLLLRLDNPIKKKRHKSFKNEKQQSNEESIHTCKQCNKSFQFRYKLLMHLRVHTKEKPFKCDECNLSFSLSGNLKRHKMIHSGDRPHICKMCDKGFIQATSLHMHIQKHHTSSNQPNFTCKICGRVFIRMAPYNLHMEKQHSTKSEQQFVPKVTAPKMEFKCDICKKEFAKLVFLRRHESRHGEKKFLCSDCGKGFVRKADLQSHIKVHTGEKPHKCPICNKTFAHTGSLVTHTLVHSGYKPYSCYICSKPFTQLSHLKVHQRTHNGERPYSCSYCGKTFALKSNLTVHIRTHTGETPYVCTICGRGFCDSSSLKKHKNSHLNVNDIKRESENDHPVST